MKIIRFYFDKGIKDDFHYFVDNNKSILIFESIILLVLFNLLLFIFKIPIIYYVFSLLLWANLFFVIVDINQSSKKINEESHEYIIKLKFIKYFYILNNERVNNKELKKDKDLVSKLNNELNKKENIDIVLLEKTKNNKIDTDSKEFKKFKNKKAKKWFKFFYPEIDKDIERNIFSKPKSRINESNSKIEESLNLLGLPKTTSNINIVKKRYHQLIREFHPDKRNTNNLTFEELQNKTIEINVAFQKITKHLKGNNPK